MRGVLKIAMPLLRLGVAAIFAYAAAIKLWNQSAFVSDIESYRLFPYALAVAISYLIPWLELVCAAALFAKRIRLAAGLLMAAMMTAFTILIIVSWARGIDISCGCFGSSDQGASYPWLISRDILILAAILPIVWNDASAKQR